jgi:cytochrome bd-type quinol oxidase subunit 2
MVKYDVLVTVAKSLRAWLMGVGFVALGAVADYMTDGNVVATLHDMPAWLVAALVPLLHAAGVALANYVKHRNDSPLDPPPAA